MLGILLVALAVAAILVTGGTSGGQAAYDAYGYNYAERKFFGLYDNADRDATNNTGDTTRLQMRWSSLVNLSQPELSAEGAWVTNAQHGEYLAADGQRYRWTYSVKLVYTGPGSPVWGYFTAEQERYVDSGGSATPYFKPPVLPMPGP